MAPGLKVTLDEQIHEVEGGFGDGIIVNAIAVELDVLGVKGLIDIGQSKASISEAAVPETSTWAMMAMGSAGLAFAYRRAEGCDDRLSAKGQGRLLGRPAL